MSLFEARHDSKSDGLRWLVAGVAVAFASGSALAGRLGVAQIALVSVAVFLVFWSVKTQYWFVEAAPFFIFLVGYDTVRYPRAALVTSDRIVGCQLRALEEHLVPSPWAATWSEFFRAHHAPWLDLITAAPYFAFVYVVAGYSLFLYFADRPRMRRFLWAFAIGNYLSFLFWIAIPAAPPWYVFGHGCEIDAAAAPSAAGLLRVDEWLRIDYFRFLYSQSSAVFGAMPSMHCAFPMMGLLTAWSHTGWKTRPLHLGYVALMALAAVYLQHHWVLDVLGGWLVAAASVAAATWLTKRWGLGSTFGRDTHIPARANARKATT